MKHKEIQNRLQNLQTQYPHENIEQVYHSAIGFYGSVAKRWPPQQFGRVLNAEGGRLGLIHNLTVYGLGFAPDHLAGFVEYNNFVRRHYYLGEKYKMGHMFSLDEAIWREDENNLYDRLGIEDINILNLGEGSDPLPVGGDRPSLGDSLELLLPLSRLRKPLADIEVDFLVTLASVGSIAESARYVGKDRKWGYNVCRKLRNATRVGVTST